MHDLLAHQTEHQMLKIRSQRKGMKKERPRVSANYKTHTKTTHKALKYQKVITKTSSLFFSDSVCTTT